MITIELPYPPTSGGRMKSWNMIKYLSKHHDTSLACLIKYGDQDIQAFEDSINLKAFLSKPAVNDIRSAKNLIKSYIAGVPINVFRNCQKTLASDISAIANDYDVILLDHYESAQFIPQNFQGKVAFHAHNATYLMWQRFSQSDAPIPYRIVAALESKRVINYEKKVCQLADLIFASPNDIDHLEDIGIDRSKCRITYHLGDDSQLTLPDMAFEETKKQLLYIGTLNWEANIDGLLWFLNEVWPKVYSTDNEITLKIVGKNPDIRLLDAAKDHSGIEFTGFVEELEPLFKESRLFLAPLRFGSGIKVKVLNAMCRGIPVITTDVGAEGIDVSNGVHLIIENEAEKMAHSILKYLEAKEQWQIIAKNSRNIIREKYNWEIVLGDMSDELLRLQDNQINNA